MIILVMGLPGSGKTTLAEALQLQLECAWYNADIIREMANDWEFSIAARLRQAYRMKALANIERQHNRTAIFDFICPTNIIQGMFKPDFLIWMDTIKKSVHEDTNQIFEPPKSPDIILRSWQYNIEQIVGVIKEKG